MKHWLLSLCAAVVALPLACSIDASLFAVEGDAGVGGTGATTTSAQGGAQVTSTGQGGAVTSTVATGGTTNVTSSTQTTTTVASSTGSGMNNCAHDICDEGAALMNNCDPCVTQVCNADPFCCNQSWDLNCTFAVQQICNIDCAPGVISCEDQYNPQPQVNFTCNQSGHACDLNANLLTTSCGKICSDRGGECINAYNDVQQCGHGQEVGCEFTGFQAGVCTCSRGCGGNPPCSNGQTCVNGSCQ